MISTFYAAAWLLVFSQGGYSRTSEAIPMPSMQFCQEEAQNWNNDTDKPGHAYCIAGQDTRREIK